MTHRIVPVEPTDEMLNAARDWSAAKYGKPIGNDAAIGCFQAMLAAVPRFEPTEAMRQKVSDAICGALSNWLPEPLHQMAYDDVARWAISAMVEAMEASDD